MNDDIRGCIAELIGTFFLCFVGASTICTQAAIGASSGEGLLIIAIAHGLVLSIAVSATIHLRRTTQSCRDYQPDSNQAC